MVSCGKSRNSGLHFFKESNSCETEGVRTPSFMLELSFTYTWRWWLQHHLSKV